MHCKTRTRYLLWAQSRSSKLSSQMLLSSCHNRHNHTSATFHHFHHNSQRLDLNFEKHFYPYLWVLSCYALILKCPPLLAIYSLLIVGFSYSCWCLWGSLEAILWNTTKHAPPLTSWRTIFLCKSARPRPQCIYFGLKANHLSDSHKSQNLRIPQRQEFHTSDKQIRLWCAAQSTECLSIF